MMRRWTRHDLQALEVLSSPVWVFDIRGHAMWWANQAAVRLWGAESLDALLARDYASDMSEATRTRLDNYYASFEAGETLEESWTLYPTGAGAVSVTCVLSGIRIDDDRLGMLVEASSPRSDVHADELRAVEALRHTRVLVSLFDAEGQPLFENPAAQRTFTQATTSPPLWSRFADPQEAQRARRALEDGETYSGEALLRTTHAERWYGIDARPTHDPVAATQAILVNARDITEQREAEAALLESKRVADRANQAKSVFLANMSHEIRTPMNGVLGMSSLLLDTRLDDDQREHVETIRLSAGNLLEIINDILDLSKIEAHKLTLEEIDFDLRTTVAGALQLHAEAAAAKGLELASSIDATVPTVVRSDPGRLRQVLLNLLSNAIKFTERGGVTVSVGVAERSSTHITLRYEVRDTGIGIDPDARERIFDSFIQADSTTTRKFGGTGLGLAIAKELASMMGGDIGLGETEGEGSTFWFTTRSSIVAQLPLPTERSSVEGAGALVVGDAKPSRPTTSGGPPDAKQQVLVVEDNRINQKVVCRMLDRLGASADVVSDGEEAVRAVTESAYALVLMDCQMPVLDGYEATRRIRGLAEPRGRVPIVAMTAGAMTGDRERCLEAGMDDYITKPIEMTELEAVLERFLERAARPA